MKNKIAVVLLIFMSVAIYIFFFSVESKNSDQGDNLSSQNNDMQTIKKEIIEENISLKAKSVLAKPKTAAQPDNVEINPQNIATSKGTSFHTGAWGESEGQFGKINDQEANPEGPMGLKVDAGGNVWALDQVNSRVKKIDSTGKVEKIVQLDSSTIKDFELDEKGNIYILDRGGSGGLNVIYSNGEKQSYDLKQISATNSFTYSKIIPFNNNIYVEQEHEKIIDVNNPQKVLSGRPSPDGSSFIKVFLASPAQGKLFLQSFNELGSLVWETPVKIAQEVFQVLLLEFDLAGNIYLAFETGLEKQPGIFSDMATIILKFSLQGHLLASSKIPATTLSAEETSSPLALDKNTSQIYQMTFTEQGTMIKKFKL